jgi:hypothetical protein
MRPMRRRPFLFLATILLGSALTSIEPALLRDVALETGNGRIVIGAVKVPLWSAAWAQGADTVSLENVTLKVGVSTYRARRIDFSGVTSSRAELDALVSASLTEPLASRLAKLNAKQVSIPELTSEETIGGIKQTTTYRNIVASDVAQGRSAKVTIDASSAEVAGAKQKSLVTQGRMVLEDFNGTELARVYTERAGPQPGALARIYGAFTVDAVSATDPSGTEIRIARISGRDLFARPTEESWSGTLSFVSAMAEMDKPSEQDNVRLMAAMADILGAFEIGQMEVVGIDMTGRTTDNDFVAMKVARIGYSGPANNRPADARLEGLELRAKDGGAKIASLSFTGFSFQSTLEGIKALKGKPLDQLDAASLRKLIPTIGTMRWSGLDFDLPDDKAKGRQAQNTRFTLKDLEITADKPLNGVPTNLRIAVQNLALPIPADGKDEQLKPLRDLGYKAVDLSFATAASWNEAGNELVIREVSTSGAEMGNITLRGTLGGVTKNVFDPDNAVAMTALVGATAKTLDLTVENAGLLDRYLAQEARKQKKTPDALRREYGAIATAAIPALLGGSAQAKSLGQAVSRFIAKPGRLTISARSKDPAGLGILYLAATADPATILDRLEVNATAE